MLAHPSEARGRLRAVADHIAEAPDAVGAPCVGNHRVERILIAMNIGEDQVFVS